MKLEKNVVIEKLDSKFVVLNINTGKYLETNQIGGYILENIDKFLNYDELLNFFYKQNKIDKKQANEDLEAFLMQAKKFKLISADE
jgi:hypothetical protein